MSAQKVIKFQNLTSYKFLFVRPGHIFDNKPVAKNEMPLVTTCRSLCVLANGRYGCLVPRKPHHCSKKEMGYQISTEDPLH